ncbi:hypothetical protein F5B17DRAFT_385965 [Nemania serpens]|nr:hypothetical protein F5B17DRAFT_385965 [Nemania serpens]
MKRLQQETERSEPKAKRIRHETEMVLQEVERSEQKAKRIEQETKMILQELEPTTLGEYITACHELVFSEWKVGSGEALTSKGPMVNPRSKLCPASLRPWPDFLQQQRITLGQLYETFPPENRVFYHRAYLTVLGKKLSRDPIYNDKTLTRVLLESVESPVNDMMKELQKVDEFRSTFNVGNGIILEAYNNTLSEDAEEVIARQTTSSPPETPYQICIYRLDDEPARRTLLNISEYQAPHKLTVQHLRRGLRPINIYEEVINRKTIPTSDDPEERFQYHAERLTVAALTQMYHNMILGGLEFGLLNTGEAIVFLKIDWEEPDTLYYHLAEPKFEAAAHPSNIQSCAAVGQYLAFILVSLGSPGQRQEHGQDERERVKTNLGTWTGDFESMLRSIPAKERQAPDDDGSSIYAPTTYSTFDRSPVVPETTGDRKPEHRPKIDEPSRSMRDYCTQKCLQGLVNAGHLDPQCPNVTSHRREGDKFAEHASLLHPVSHDEWLQLLSQQLAQSLDRGVVRLGMEGVRGVPFQVTMLTYGYTFICKGTVREFIKDLEYEAAVYERLKPVQGISVPIFLGAIDLRSINRTYYYDHRIAIIHMTFLSWGGHDLYKVKIGEGERMRLGAGLSRALRAVHQQGVVHGNIRRPNILQNHETGDIMLIDFERASLLDDPLDQRFEYERGEARRFFYG